jgi:integrase
VTRSRSAAPRKDIATGTWGFVVDLGEGYDAKGVWRQRRQARRRGFATKAAAQEALDALRSDSRRGDHVMRDDLTVGDWLDHWLAVTAARVKPSTLDFYTAKVERYVRPRIGDVRLQQLDTATLDRLYAELVRSGRANGKGLSVSTVRHVATIMRMSLDAAVRARKIQFNPAMSAQPPRHNAAGRPEMKTWSAAEVAAFLEHEKDTRYANVWTFLALTGCRRGEALGLTWDDVDLRGSRVTICRTITAVDHVIHRSSSTKTNKGRTIRLQPELVAALKAQRRRQAEERLLLGEGYADEGLVFAQVDGRPLHPDHFSREFDRRVKRSGLARIRLHDLRHTYATLALAAGTPAKVVADRLGHSSVTITLDTYSHVMPAVEGDHADVIARLISDAKPGAVVTNL